MTNQTSKTKTLHFFYRGLIQLYQKPPHTAQGYILFLVISLSIALSGLLVAYAILAKVHSISVKSAANSNSGFYGAEGALNTRAEQLRTIFINYLTPTGTAPTSLSACMDTDTTNNGSGNFACQSQTFAASDSSSNGITAYSYVVDSTSYEPNGQPPRGTVPPGESFQNLNMLEYRYSINSVTQKANASSGEVMAMTNMAIKSRLVPMFQFAAFYLNDLEILPGAVMNLSGPIHTNGNLYLGSDNGLNINSQVTLSKSLYNSRKDRNTTYPDGKVTIKDMEGDFLNLLLNGTGSNAPTRAAMDPNLVASAWGSQVKLGIDALSIPNASILNLNGDYYNKADLQIRYTPAATSTTGNNATSPNPATVPFTITSIRRTASGTVSSSTALTEGELRSLRQPVLLNKTLSALTGTYNLCTPGTAATIDNTITSDSDWDTTVKSGIVNALAVAIASQTTPIALNSVNTAFSTYATNTRLLPASSPPERNTALNTTLGSIIETVFASSLTPEQRTTLKTNLVAATPAEIAALDGRCFIGAPLQDIGRNASTHNSPYQFYNDREQRHMRLLQINIESLTAWNKVGRYVTFSSGSVTNNNSGLGFLADQRIFATASANSNAPAGSFDNLGLAGSDTSEGGFVFHATIDTTIYSSASGNQSPYGLALVQAQQLPGLATTTTTLDPTGLTFVSDQAVYIQGDYNTLNWQPASILADSLNVLSNACLNTDSVIHKVIEMNCNTGSGAAKITTPTATTINSAFLSGTDLTTCTNGSTTNIVGLCYNGGLENYPRLSEDWTGITLTYRGSFVSTSIPLHVSGTWKRSDNTGYYGAPGRNWDYDTRFNAAQNLPPLAPRFVYLKQESFTRNYNQ